MKSIPGILGAAAPPSRDETQKTLRSLQQQITALATAQTVQAASTSAFVTRAYNGFSDHFDFPDPNTWIMGHQGIIDCPMRCSSAIVHIVCTVGNTGGSGIFVAPAVWLDGENPDVGGTTAGDSVTTEVFGYASLTSSFVRELPALGVGDPVHLGAMTASVDATTGNGNAHVTAMLVFIR